MNIDVTCPHCGEQLSIPSQYAGTMGACNACKGKFTVPAPTATVVKPALSSPGSRTPLILAGVVLVALLAGTAVYFLRGDSTDDPQGSSQVPSTPIADSSFSVRLDQIPLKVGKQWTFTDGAGAEYIAEYVGTSDRNGTPSYEREFRAGGQVQQRDHWSAEGSVLNQYYDTQSELPVNRFEFPLTIGKTWNYEGYTSPNREGVSGTIPVQASVASIEELALQAGTFKCAKVVLTRTWPGRGPEGARKGPGTHSVLVCAQCRHRQAPD